MRKFTLFAIAIVVAHLTAELSAFKVANLNRSKRQEPDGSEPTTEATSTAATTEAESTEPTTTSDPTTPVSSTETTAASSTESETTTEAKSTTTLAPTTPAVTSTEAQSTTTSAPTTPAESSTEAESTESTSIETITIPIEPIPDGATSPPEPPIILASTTPIVIPDDVTSPSEPPTEVTTEPIVGNPNPVTVPIPNSSTAPSVTTIKPTIKPTTKPTSKPTTKPTIKPITVPPPCQTVNPCVPIPIQPCPILCGQSVPNYSCGPQYSSDPEIEALLQYTYRQTV